MDEAERLHHQIEAIRLGFELAIDVVGEPTPEMLEQVRQALSSDGLAAARSRITNRARAATRPQGANAGDTSYVCAVDPEGNAVSLMTSICGLFGSGLVAGDTGVLLNNRATQFSSQPGHPNALAPGHRPRHSILPAMVLRDGLPELLMGVIGGNAHPQGLTQILVTALDRGMNPQQAVDAQRFKLIMQSGAVHIDVAVQAPPAQISPPAHARPQAPQLRGSLCTSAQAPPQLRGKPVHTAAHAPADERGREPSGAARRGGWRLLRRLSCGGVRGPVEGV
jgi:gamma-glutamyltranspeptidase/glutathione hydrolase